MTNKIAFFDFDGTITTTDSLFLFIKHLAGKKGFYIGLIKNIHFLCAYVLGILSNASAKEKLMQYFIKGMRVQDFSQRCQTFLPLLERIVKQSALQRIREYQKEGTQVVIVSATFEEYLKIWCQKIGVDCIGTQLEVKNGVMSGKFASANCYAEQKVIRIKQKYCLQEYQEIDAYGDSKGDMEMLSIATKSFFRFFK